MKKRIVWLAVACLMVAALLLASCAPAATPTATPTPTGTGTATPTPTPTPGVEMITVKATKVDGTVVTKTMEKPRYGGTLTFPFDRPPAGWDDAFTKWADCRFNMVMYNSPMDGDWARGPAGTGEAGWIFGGFDGMWNLTGYALEKWELKDPVTMIWYARKGVHFWDKPPVNGREMTADDIVYSIKRSMASPLSSLRAGQPWGFEIEATDKWTIVVKSPAPEYTGEILRDVTCQCWIVPREMVEKHGDLKLWENACGIGPFILIDYVPGSSAYFKRNPNYWLKDPLTGMQLPYADAVKLLIIEDRSTQLAALRTDKIDQLGHKLALELEEMEAMVKANPKLKYIKHLKESACVLAMRTDKPELPFKDVRVRRALHMAIDFDSIIKDYYGGQAEKLSFPVAPIAEHANYYIPLDKLPASVQELFSYNPDKAKKLLAEAGYPNGFKTEVLCWSKWVDTLSIIKDYWSRIGVDLKLDVKEQVVYVTMKTAHTQKEMYLNERSFTAPFKMLDYRPGQPQNLSEFDDERTNKAYDAMALNFFDEPERDRVMREWLPYCLDQAWYIQMVQSYQFTLWQPWVKNYMGEHSVGYSSRMNWPQFVWIDQELKQRMVGRR